MPFFISISGYFYRDYSSFKDTLIKGSRILISFYFYGLLFIAINYLILQKFESRYLLALILAKPVDIWEIPFFGVFWFLITLLVIKLVAVKIKITTITTIVAFLLYFQIAYLNEEISYVKNLPFSLGQSMTLFVFYCLGLSLKKVNTIYVQYIFYFCFLVFPLLSFWLVNIIEAHEAKLINYHHLFVFNPLITMIIAVFGIFVLFSFSLLLSKVKNFVIYFITKVGENSFTYYVLHLFTFFLIRKLLKVTGFESDFSPLVILVLSLLLIGSFIKLVAKLFQNHKIVQQILFLK
jgi:fucose 4-O-acetylase-like acetyltransferase